MSNREEAANGFTPRKAMGREYHAESKRLDKAYKESLETIKRLEMPFWNTKKPHELNGHIVERIQADPACQAAEKSMLQLKNELGWHNAKSIDDTIGELAEDDGD